MAKGLYSAILGKKKNSFEFDYNEDEVYYRSFERRRIMKFSSPLIVISDMETSRHFYEKVLGQKVILDFGANITFDGGFSLQTKDSWANFIDKSPEEITPRSNAFELYFEEDYFDKFLEEIEKVDGIEYVHPMKKYDWHQRVVRFYDPDGNIIEVGESMASIAIKLLKEGHSVEETAKIIQHPVEFVNFCASQMQENPE